MHPLSELRELARQAQTIADQLEGAVSRARDAGHSWEDIANQLYANGRSGRLPLGTIFPGGTSATTIRRMYEAPR